MQVEGKLSKKQTDKLIRNEKKLKDSVTNMELTGKKVAEISNKINLERFKWQNPLLIALIAS